MSIFNIFIEIIVEELGESSSRRGQVSDFITLILSS